MKIVPQAPVAALTAKFSRLPEQAKPVVAETSSAKPAPALQRVPSSTSVQAAQDNNALKHTVSYSVTRAPQEPKSSASTASVPSKQSSDNLLTAKSSALPPASVKPIAVPVAKEKAEIVASVSVRDSIASIQGKQPLPLPVHHPALTHQVTLGDRLPPPKTLPHVKTLESIKQGSIVSEVPKANVPSTTTAPAPHATTGNLPLPKPVFIAAKPTQPGTATAQRVAPVVPTAPKPAVSADAPVNAFQAWALKGMQESDAPRTVSSVLQRMESYKQAVQGARPVGAAGAPITGVATKRQSAVPEPDTETRHHHISNLVKAKVHSFEPTPPPSISLVLSTLPLDIVYSSYAVNRFADFFSTSEENFPSETKS